MKQRIRERGKKGTRTEKEKRNEKIKSVNET